MIVQAPLLSIDAHGNFASSVCFASRRQGPTAMRPRNPNRPANAGTSHGWSVLNDSQRIYGRIPRLAPTLRAYIRTAAVKGLRLPAYHAALLVITAHSRAQNPLEEVALHQWAAPLTPVWHLYSPDADNATPAPGSNWHYAVGPAPTKLTPYFGYIYWHPSAPQPFPWSLAANPFFQILRDGKPSSPIYDIRDT